MTEDAVMVLATGEVMDRDTVVAALGQAPPWCTYEISDIRFVQTGPDSAALVYRGTAYRDTDEPAFIGPMSSVYVLRNNEWRLALYQQTAIPRRQLLTARPGLPFRDGCGTAGRCSDCEL